MTQLESNSDQTLDPPGTIAVIGGGLLGVEAALYGRYLGYSVTLIEAKSIGHSRLEQRDQPLPMLPDRCLSPLALSALKAQNPDSPPLVLPTTVGAWIDDVMVALTETDLLRGHIRCDAKVRKIEQLDVEPDADDEMPPADFRITIDEDESIDAEAVIVAIGDATKISTGFPASCPYFFLIERNETGDSERQLLQGFQRIVEIYAKLADRELLDLYRPVRGIQRVGVEIDEVSDNDEE